MKISLGNIFYELATLSNKLFIPFFNPKDTSLNFMNNLACLSNLLDKQNINVEKVSYYLNGLFHNLESFCRLQGFI